MKRTVVLLLTIFFCAAIFLFAGDNKNDATEMIGWICNAKCVDQSSGKATCNTNRSETIGKVVFISDDGQILQIANQGKAQPMAGIPLLWAHAEYLKLQRSVADAKVFDLVEPVFNRCAACTAEGRPNEVWKFDRQVPGVAAGTRLRIQAESSFLLHWTTDEWQHATDTRSKSTALGIEFVDLPPTQQRAPIRFTFFWPNDNRWEGKDYRVEVQAAQTLG